MCSESISYSEESGLAKGLSGIVCNLLGLGIFLEDFGRFSKKSEYLLLDGSFGFAPLLNPELRLIELDLSSLNIELGWKCESKSYSGLRRK